MQLSEWNPQEGVECRTAVPSFLLYPNKTQETEVVAV
jgi:hypothetical protein